MGMYVCVHMGAYICMHMYAFVHAQGTVWHGWNMLGFPHAYFILHSTGTGAGAMFVVLIGSAKPGVGTFSHNQYVQNTLNYINMTPSMLCIANTYNAHCTGTSSMQNAQHICMQ